MILPHRCYDSRTGRRWNLDPVVKEWESPYMCFGDNPITGSDVLGNTTNGDYYGKDGKHLGSDKKQDDKAYVVSPDIVKKYTTAQGATDWNGVQKDKNTIDLTTKYKLSNTNLLNRANWVYGEGGGFYPDHYAHTIENLRKHGVSGRKPYESDDSMFSQKMTHQTGKKGHNKIINMYPGYFNGTDGNVNSKKIAATRGNLSALTNDTQIKAAVGAVIGSVVGFTKDPTNGAYQWVGGAGEKGGIAKNPATNNATNVTNLNSGTGKVHVTTHFIAI